MLHVGSVCTPCCMLLRVVASCCAMLDPFALLLQHCWGHARALHMDCLEFTKSYRYVSFPRCTAGPNIVWSSCIRLHTIAKTDTTIPNSVASVFTGLDLYRSPLFKCVCGGRGGLCRAGRREPWERGCFFCNNFLRCLVVSIVVASVI